MNKALAAYRNSIKQSIDRYNSATSISATFTAYQDAPSSLPSAVKYTSRGLGAYGRIAATYGLKSIPNPITATMWAATEIWNFLDGVAGVSNASDKAAVDIMKNIDAARSDYWKSVGDCK